MSVPAYRLLFYSAAIVIFGVMGQAVARGWLARELTGSNAGLGGVMLVFGASMLVATPLGGVAADRYPKRLVLMLAVLALDDVVAADRDRGDRGRDRVLDVARRQRRAGGGLRVLSSRPGSR